MNARKIGDAIAKLFFATIQLIADALELLGDTTWPRRYMTIRDSDGTERRGVIVSQEDDMYLVEFRLTEPRWYTFWKYDTEHLRIQQDDARIRSIDAPMEWFKGVKPTPH